MGLKQGCVAMVTVGCLISLVSPHAAALVKIEYWGMTSDPIYAEKLIIDEFNRQHAGEIEVTGVSVPGGVPGKLPVAVAGGAPPAVAKLDRFMIGTFASEGTIQPIDGLIQRDKINIGNYFPAAVGETTYNGRIFGMPLAVDDRGLYYNTELFDESGLDPTKPPLTWSQVDLYSRKLDRRKGDGTLEHIGFVPHWGNWYFVGWLWAAGGDLLDTTNHKVTWNSEAGRTAVRWMVNRLRTYGGNGTIAQLNSRKLFLCGWFRYDG